jgi:hypothetical protein
LKSGFVAIVASDRSPLADHFPGRREDAFRADSLPERAVERSIVHLPGSQHSTHDDPTLHAFRLPAPGWGDQRRQQLDPDPCEQSASRGERPIGMPGGRRKEGARDRGARSHTVQRSCCCGLTLPDQARAFALAAA